MEEAGTNTKIFKPHSTRAASTSAANQKSFPLENILEAAGWKSDSVFAKYYNEVVLFHMDTSMKGFHTRVKA